MEATIGNYFQTNASPRARFVIAFFAFAVVLVCVALFMFL
jgi:hypothetical protein